MKQMLLKPINTTPFVVYVFTRFHNNLIDTLTDYFETLEQAQEYVNLIEKYPPEIEGRKLNVDCYIVKEN